MIGELIYKICRKTQIYTDKEIKAIIAESDLADNDALTQAAMQITQKTGATLLRPQMPQVTPQQVQAIRPEDKPDFFRKVQDGMTGFQIYNEKYPALKRVHDDLVKYRAVEMLFSQLRSDELAEYSVTVTTSPYSPTARMANLMEMAEFQDRYGLIPPDMFLEATNLTNKDDILARLRPQMQAAEQQAQAGMAAQKSVAGNNPAAAQPPAMAGAAL
jgi:hypothetical protein